ncbi:hypothetical protein [Legionella jamestowniensis]|uniref:Bile acid beta-glucosidase n=1 Tax=Legionella jamestowniensis TaxID=455 RepID=A0A0W0ULE1_9GAMM|nr:hypothetical protein [Legionella jamestowniensis]KTD08720.1 bile acid beta-glucosidase [Legionella jamestowniensis]OCH96842.1 hypothetical protein A8135_04150 [Legionella jamestowniensis]SFL55519.1 hypothetical protein SAMN02746073_0866 [Legionella jamestowniensis DSM 19215]
MKFKGQFENRYNEFWNNQIVLSYKQIKNSYKQPGFFTIDNTIDQANAVHHYCDGVVSILRNLSRQFPFFTDKERVGSYFNQTKEVVISDLNKFKTHIKNPMVLSEIEYTLAVLDTITPQEAIQETDSADEMRNEWEEMMETFDKEHSLGSLFTHSRASAALFDQEEDEEISKFLNS